MYFLKKENDKENIMNSLSNLFSGCFVNDFKTDVIEKDDKYILYVEVPGVDKKDINLEYMDSYLTIKVTKDLNNDDSNDEYIRKERCISSSSRSFYLENGDENNISARLENGILNITVMKLESKNNKNKRIVIE